MYALHTGHSHPVTTPLPSSTSNKFLSHIPVCSFCFVIHQDSPGPSVWAWVWSCLLGPDGLSRRSTTINSNHSFPQMINTSSSGQRAGLCEPLLPGPAVDRSGPVWISTRRNPGDVNQWLEQLCQAQGVALPSPLPCLLALTHFHPLFYNTL